MNSKLHWFIKILITNIIIFLMAPSFAKCPTSITINHHGISDEFLYKGGNNIELWSGGSLTGTISMSPDDTYIGYMEPEAKAAMLDWINCLRSTKTSQNGKQRSSDAGRTNAEQYPNCPPTLPSGCVTWSLHNQQLQWWNLTNNCGRDVSVSFKFEGALENTQTFGNGESYRAKWRGTNPPKQIVWDAAKGSRFYRGKPAGAALKCRASLPL